MHLHHSGLLLVEQHSALINDAIVGPSALRKRLLELLEDTGNELPPMCRDLAAVLRDQLSILDERIALLERKIQQWCVSNEGSQRLTEIPGVDVISATAITSAISNARVFTNGWCRLARAGASPGIERRAAMSAGNQ